MKRGDHVTELEEALEAVACGRGITIVPEDILRHPHWRERIRVIHPNSKAVRNTLYMLSLGTPSADVELVARLLRS
jgi:DNA-binding transcriptional LysR family regulator